MGSELVNQSSGWKKWALRPWALCAFLVRVRPSFTTVLPVWLAQRCPSTSTSRSSWGLVRPYKERVSFYSCVLVRLYPARRGATQNPRQGKRVAAPGSSNLALGTEKQGLLSPYARPYHSRSTYCVLNFWLISVFLCLNVPRIPWNYSKRLIGLRFNSVLL